MIRFNIDNFDERLTAKNAFDGNLQFGAKHFHETTKRTGAGRPSSGHMTAEHSKVVRDTGIDRYERRADLWTEVNKCLVCGSADREFLLSRMGLEIHRCKTCTHRYLSPHVKFEKAMEIYGDDKTASDIYTQPLQIEIDEKKYQYGLDLMHQLNPPARDRIMDLGCGAGTMLKVAHRNGWKQCVGVDVNERYGDIYQANQEIQFINAFFESLDPQKLGREYDVISMWSVLEHLYDLHNILDRVHSMLKPNGLLFILVPNAESLITRIARSLSPTFNWKHVSHFTRRSLNKLMEMHKLREVFAETVITEIDNIKSYLSGEYPYYGYGDPDHLFDWITPEYIHQNFLGSRLIAIFRKENS